MPATTVLRLLTSLVRHFLRRFLTVISQVSGFNLLILFILITTFICFDRALLLYHILKGFWFGLISAGLALISAAWCSSASLFVLTRLIFFILFPNLWINLLYSNTSAAFVSKIVLFELVHKSKATRAFGTRPDIQVRLIYNILILKFCTISSAKYLWLPKTFITVEWLHRNQVALIKKMTCVYILGGFFDTLSKGFVISLRLFSAFLFDSLNSLKDGVTSELLLIGHCSILWIRKWWCNILRLASAWRGWRRLFLRFIWIAIKQAFDDVFAIVHRFLKVRFTIIISILRVFSNFPSVVSIMLIGTLCCICLLVAKQLLVIHCANFVISVSNQVRLSFIMIIILVGHHLFGVPKYLLFVVIGKLPKLGPINDAIFVLDIRERWFWWHLLRRCCWLGCLRVLLVRWACSDHLDHVLAAWSQFWNRSLEHENLIENIDIDKEFLRVIGQDGGSAWSCWLVTAWTEQIQADRQWLLNSLLMLGLWKLLSGRKWLTTDLESNLCNIFKSNSVVYHCPVFVWTHCSPNPDSIIRIWVF